MTNPRNTPQAVGAKKPLPESKPDYVVKAATPAGQRPVPPARPQQGG